MKKNFSFTIDGVTYHACAIRTFQIYEDLRPGREGLQYPRVLVARDRAAAYARHAGATAAVFTIATVAPATATPSEVLFWQDGPFHTSLFSTPPAEGMGPICAMAVAQSDTGLVVMRNTKDQSRVMVLAYRNRGAPLIRPQMVFRRDTFKLARFDVSIPNPGDPLQEAVIHLPEATYNQLIFSLEQAVQVEVSIVNRDEVANASDETVAAVSFNPADLLNANSSLATCVAKAKDYETTHF